MHKEQAEQEAQLKAEGMNLLKAEAMPLAEIPTATTTGPLETELLHRMVNAIGQLASAKGTEHEAVAETDFLEVSCVAQ